MTLSDTNESTSFAKQLMFRLNLTQIPPYAVYSKNYKPRPRMMTCCGILKIKGAFACMHLWKCNVKGHSLVLSRRSF